MNYPIFFDFNAFAFVTPYLDLSTMLKVILSINLTYCLPATYWAGNCDVSALCSEMDLKVFKSHHVGGLLALGEDTSFCHIPAQDS